MAATAGPRRQGRTARGDAVLAVVRSSQRPVSAFDIYDATRFLDPAPGLSTIYRVLRTLVDEGAVHAFRVGGETTYRVCGTEPHVHLVCDDCGQVASYSAARFTSWGDRSIGSDFLVADRRIEVHGLCAVCATKVVSVGERRSGLAR